MFYKQYKLTSTSTIMEYRQLPLQRLCEDDAFVNQTKWHIGSQTYI